ncbi:helix-turn-helix domain-containing protein [Williamsia herbipolensis]|uniref:helix-turn-helix domain-containing protein n=1 Tax=Williamsia herbipolensis TaxID=1603258 RepID=UPI003B84520D
MTRGTDVELTNVLTALHLASLDWRSAATGIVKPSTAELEPRSEWIGTRQAADLLGISDRAVRKAIVEKRLAATSIGQGYRVRREDVEHYRSARRSRAA